MLVKREKDLIKKYNLPEHPPPGELYKVTHNKGLKNRMPGEKNAGYVYYAVQCNVGYTVITYKYDPYKWAVQIENGRKLNTEWN